MSTLASRCVLSFNGLEYFEPSPPCDPTQIGRFRKLLGENGVEELLSQTIQTAFKEKLVDASDIANVIIDSTVQSKATTHPTYSRLLQVARNKLVKAAKECGLSFKQTFEKEAKTLKRKAGGYTHAKQFKWLKKVIKRQSGTSQNLRQFDPLNNFLLRYQYKTSTIYQSTKRKRYSLPRITA